MRLTFLAFALFASHVGADPIIFQLKNSLESELILMNPKTGKFVPLLANSSIEFALFDRADWIIVYDNITTSLDVLLKAQSKKHETVPLCSIQLAIANGALFTAMDDYGTIDTGIPTVLFTHLVRL